jgi:hypothetical protein
VGNSVVEFAIEDEGKAIMNIEQANTEAAERMEAQPVLVGLGKARDVIPGMRDNLLLHASG